MPLQSIDAEVAIVGGGVAGLWTLRRLVTAGYNAVLFEADALGGKQTLASQGMIHGGLKYALTGKLTRASEAISTMPARWRACLGGTGEVDLRGLPVLSDRYYMFAPGNTLGRLTSFFASKGLRGRINKLTPANYPAAFAGYDGIVYEMNDLVIDTGELIARLAAPVADRIYQLRVEDAHLTDDTLGVTTWISCAGIGSSLLAGERIPMQRRPLKQVIVRHTLPQPIYAHCLKGISRAEPRLTITTHGTGSDQVVYLGGQIATDGVDRSDDEQIRFARAELADCVPWIDWQHANFATLDIDRAEPRQTNAQRPDEAYVHQVGNFVQAWPTKLSLAPDLGDQVLTCLPPPRGGAMPVLDLPRPAVARAPWQ